MEQHDARLVDALASGVCNGRSDNRGTTTPATSRGTTTTRIRAFPRRAPSPPTFEMSMARDALLAGRLMGLDNHRESVRERVKWQNIRGE